MKTNKALIVLLLSFSYLLPAKAYRPKFPDGPYYFMSENKLFLAEITPTVMRSRDSKHLLVKDSQAISIYSKNDNNSWKEEGYFRTGRMHLIKEVLIPNNGKVVVIRIDENPMAEKINKDDGIFIYSVDGKKMKSYSHFSLFNRPGIFRNMKLDIDNKLNQLMITNKDEVAKLALPK
jgi:hypothetical protein